MTQTRPGGGVRDPHMPARILPLLLRQARAHCSASRGSASCRLTRWRSGPGERGAQPARELVNVFRTARPADSRAPHRGLNGRQRHQEPRRERLGQLFLVGQPTAEAARVRVDRLFHLAAVAEAMVPQLVTGCVPYSHVVELGVHHDHRPAELFARRTRQPGCRARAWRCSRYPPRAVRRTRRRTHRGRHCYRHVRDWRPSSPSGARPPSQASTLPPQVADPAPVQRAGQRGSPRTAPAARGPRWSDG